MNGGGGIRVAHRFVSVAGDRTHLLHDAGEPAVLFLHGVGGSAWTFDAVLAEWEPPGWLAPDLLGYGESSWLPDGVYSSARQVAQLIGVLDRLGVERLDVVGFSWGGLIGLELAARYGRVNRLAIIDIAPSSSAPPTAVPRIPELYPELSDAVDAVRGLAPRAESSVVRRDAELSTSPTTNGFRKKIDPGLLQFWQFRTEDHWDVWQRNTCETLLVRAEQSPVLSADDAHRMLVTNPKVEFREIPDCGHLVPLERPAALASVLADFLG
jgi:pimeloyl-ACP methyl ester carboxylesterase